MSTPTDLKKAKLVSIERAEQLIDCYGANTQAWPEDERVAATSLIQASSELQQQLQNAQQLDDSLNSKDLISSDNAALAKRILKQLPDQTTTKFTSTTHNHAVWKKTGMIAAGFMLLIVSFFTIQSPNQALNPTPVVAQNELDQWLWDEISNNNTETEDDEDLSFMAMIDFEI